jgi:hypothetical protein
VVQVHYSHNVNFMNLIEVTDSIRKRVDSCTTRTAFDDAVSIWIHLITCRVCGMFSMLNASLIDRLRSALPSWKSARLECLGYLIVSIMRNRTVNLVKLSSEASVDLKDESL